MTLITPRHAATSPLSSTQLDVAIDDLVAQYTVRHRFENIGESAIEAVFTFPIPLDAAFLGMRATLAGETVHAQIQPRRQATRAYDDAIADGHSAVLLSAPEPGVLNVSLGNLKPGETGDIELRFAVALKVSDRVARFSVPFVHRPRFGRWSLEDLETPTHDLLAEYPMTATIRVRGLLANAAVTCATHAARFARGGDTLELTIPQALLDRDLVLGFELDATLAPSGRVIADGEQCLGLASFVMPSGQDARRPLDLLLVLDGSGSMNGDAIAQSRAALLAVIEALDDSDRIQVLRFGSQVVPMLRRPMPATARVRDALRGLVGTINADLGGTEMEAALLAALKQLGEATPGRERVIILVTDGAVQPGELGHAQAAALQAGVRIFVVAVGSSAGAEVLAPLAETTGAVLERAVPAEPIDAGVMRQFRRARAGAPAAVQVRWPCVDAQPIAMGVFYPGDAASVAAILPANVAGEVVITCPASADSLCVPLGVPADAPALRALLGQRRYQLADEGAREALALHYGLLTTHTSAVLVKQRAEADKADGLPVVVPVPQMLPEGMLRVACAPSFAAMLAPRVGSITDSYLDMPMFLRRTSDDMTPCGIPAPEPPLADDEALSLAWVPEPPAVAPMSWATIHTPPPRDLLLALYHTLADAVLVRRIDLSSLDAALAALPENLRDPTRDLLVRIGLHHDQWHTTTCLHLLWVLHSILQMPAFSADPRAIMTQRRRAEVEGLLGRVRGHLERRRLRTAIERAMREG